ASAGAGPPRIVNTRTGIIASERRSGIRCMLMMASRRGETSIVGRRDERDESAGYRVVSEPAGLDDPLEELLGPLLRRMGEDLLGRSLLQDDPVVQEADS